MSNSISFKYVSPADCEKVGFRAVDIASIEHAGYPVPLGFVIPCAVFSSFLNQSGLQDWIRHIYEKNEKNHEGFLQSYKEIKELFRQVNFSGMLRSEFSEGYESLAISSASKQEGFSLKQSAMSLIDNSISPKVNIIPSPNYESKKDIKFCLKKNVVGMDNFLSAVKECWSDFFIPELVEERLELGKSIDSFNLGLVVEQVLPAQAHAWGTFRKQTSAHPIKVLSYKGAWDTDDEVGKDEYLLTSDHLGIVKSTIRHQEFKIVCDDEGRCQQIGLGMQASKAKLNDRQVLEIARLTKRAHVVLESDVEVAVAIQGDEARIIFVQRNPFEFIENTSVGEKFAQLPEEYEQDQEDEVMPQIEIVDEEQEKESLPVEKYVPDSQVSPTPDFEHRDYQRESFLMDSPQSLHSSAEPKIEIVDMDEPTEEYVSSKEVEESQEEFIVENKTEEPREETLFDMVGSQPQPSQEIQEEEKPVASEGLSRASVFIRHVGVSVEDILVHAYENVFDQQPINVATAVEVLKERDALPLDAHDVLRLEEGIRLVDEGIYPNDELLGVAWRLQMAVHDYAQKFFDE